MNNILNQIAESTPEELTQSSRTEKVRAGIYAGIAGVSAALGKNSEGTIKKVATAASIGSGLMAWYHGSKAMVLGGQTPESHERIVAHVGNSQINIAPSHDVPPRNTEPPRVA